MIVIEGPDGAGKSTLSNQLLSDGTVSQVLPSPRLNAKGNPDAMKYETNRYLRLYSGNNDVAVDRFLFSEMAYGPVIRDGSKFSFAEYLGIVQELMNGRDIIIFCIPTRHHFKESESKFLIEKMPLIRQRYETMYGDLKDLYSGILLYNWQEQDAYQKLKEAIRKNLQGLLQW